MGEVRTLTYSSPCFTPLHVSKHYLYHHLLARSPIEALPNPPFRRPGREGPASFITQSIWQTTASCRPPLDWSNVSSVASAGGSLNLLVPARDPSSTRPDRKSGVSVYCLFDLCSLHRHCHAPWERQSSQNL